MPKKTKKEKIIAEYRRKLQTVSVPNLHRNQSKQVLSQPEQIHTYRLSQIDSTITVSGKASAAYTDDFPAIRNDLFKTIIFAAIAVLVELALYLRIGK